MKRCILIICLIICVSDLFAQTKILFDNTKSETAGNADWVIDNDQPIPSPAQSGITSTTPENYWTGALSSWGVEMVKQGFYVETLPSSGRITYGDGTNTQDLSNYKVFVVCEPNNPFSAAEKTAMMNFVSNGGGLFIVADHAIADRDGDGWDALEVWNDFITNNPVKNNAFGFVFDAGSNISADPTLNVSTLANDPILHGVKGDVLGISFFNGSSMTINTTDNPSVKAAVYLTGYSNTGTTGVMVAYATYGSGKVVAVGDSSVPEDETAQSGTTYAGWTQPNVGSVADGDDGVLMTNGTIWLAQSGSVVIDPEPTNNVTNFSAINPTSSSIQLTWTDAVGGTLPTSYLVKWNTSSSITNPVDGTPEADGVGKKNVAKGVQTTTITGLTSGTTYYFKIFPYTNTGTNIDYLVSSTPSASATTTTETTSILNSENFDNCASITWIPFDVAGDDFWTCGSGYESMNGYGGTTDEDWLISPALNLNVYSGEVLTFKTATQYTGPALELVYSTNYDGTSNPSTQGTWNNLTFTAATTTSFTPSGNVSLDGISGTSVYIAFKYKATGTASGQAALWEVDDILIEGSTCSTPTVQSSNLTFSGVGTNSMTLNWTNGDGGKRIVKMNTSNSFTNPTDGTDPTANTVYSGGEQVVYNNSGSSVTVAGLAANSTYWFRVYDYNCTGTNTKYLVSSATNNPKSQLTNNVDITPPTVSMYNPADNATTVNSTDNLILTFNENVKVGTAGSITIYNGSGSVFETIPYNDSRITFLNSTVTINPTNTFASGSSYYVYIDATAITDLAGNAYAGISSSTTWNFVIKDTNPPTVSTFSPADNATNVNSTDNLILTFNENVKVGTAGSITIYNGTGSVFETIPYNDSRIAFLNSTVTINPTNTFASGSSYYVYIDATAITDMAGNAYAGISNNTTWNFVIKDTNPPTVSTYSPADNATNVNNTDNLILTFNENVNIGTAGYITIYNGNATTFETIPYNDSRISFLNNVVTINPSNSFISGSAYYVNVDDMAINDMAGNAFAGISNNTSWNFVIKDTNSPTVLTYSPEDNATTVNSTDNLFLTFNKNVKLGTAGYITIYNDNATTFEVIPYNDSRISFLNNVVKINPSNSFLNGTSYYVNIDATAIQDISGNAYAGILNNTTWNFTTQTANSVSDLGEGEYLIYPNPTSSVFKVSLPNASKKLDISIVDINGRIRKQINSLTEKETSIDISGFAKGIYFVKLQMDGKVYLQKLIVQ